MPVTAGHVRHRGVITTIEQALPAPGSRERLDKGAVRLGLSRRHELAVIGGDDALAAAAALDTRAVSIAGGLPVSLLSAASRW
jgi:hypothetical protein